MQFMIKGRKLSLSAILILTTVLTIVFGVFLYRQVTAESNGMSGTGTAFDPYIIVNCVDLQNIAISNNDFNTDGNFFYILGGDIDCTATTSWNEGNGFLPIGGYGRVFNGHLDGQGYTISNLYINCQVITDELPSIGLFRGVDSNATVNNLKLANAHYDTTTCDNVETVGGLSAVVGGVVTDVSFDGTITTACNQYGSSIAVGGLVGSLFGRVIRSNATGSITQSGANCSYTTIGGLIGAANSSNAPIADNFAAVNITVSNQSSDCWDSCQNIGGLVGDYTGAGDITNSYAAGSIVLAEDPYQGLAHAIGGIIGNYTDIGSTLSLSNVFTTTAINIDGSLWCDIETCGDYIRSVGALEGNNGPSTDDYSTAYFDQTAVGFSNCDNEANDDASSCIAVNTDGGQNNYFKSNHINPPLNNWDFGSTWETTAGLPHLRNLTDQYPNPPPNLTTTALSPNSLQIDWDLPDQTGRALFDEDHLADTVHIEYRIGDTGTWLAPGHDDFDVVSTQQAILRGLPASSTVQIRVALLNDDGYWSTPSVISGITGTPGFHQISDCQGLQNIQADLTANYELTKDIDCSDTITWNDGMGFMPLGDCTLSQNIFTGIFDGNNFTIQDLYISQTVTDCPSIGLFGLAGQALIQDVSLVRPTIINVGNIYNISNPNTYTLAKAASLVGTDIGSTIQNAHVSDAIIVGANTIGGLIGEEAGGLAQYDMVFNNNSFAGTLQSDRVAIIGGLVGSFSAVASNTTLVDNNYSVASIDIDGFYGNYLNAGGAFGGLYGDELSEVIVAHTYATGTITTPSSIPEPNRFIGGFLGITGASADHMQIENSFSHMTLINADPDQFTVSGFGAMRAYESYTVNYINNYFDANLMGTSACSSADFADCTAVEDSPAYFYNNTTNPPLDEWDFDTIWETTDALPVFKSSVINSPTPISEERLNRINNTIDLGSEDEEPNDSGSNTNPTLIRDIVIKEPSGAFAININGGSTGETAPKPQGLIERVSEQLKNFVRNLPESVVRSFPYGLFGLVVLGIGVMLAETARQSQHLRLLQALISKQRSIAQQRDTFWHLAANYLRAPVTLLMGGIELLELDKKRPAGAAAISKQVKDMQTKVAGIMEDIESSNTLQDIEWPKEKVAKSVLGSIGFWMPIVVLGGLILFANYIATSFRNFDVSTVTYLTQAMIFSLVVYALYWALGSFRGVRSKVSQAEAMVAKQTKALGAARRGLVNQSVDLLGDDIPQLQKEVDELPKNSKAKEPLHEGGIRLGQMLGSFQLLSAAQAGQLDELSPAGSQSNLGKALQNALAVEEDVVSHKGLVVDTPHVAKLEVPGSSQLTEQVVGSVLDNAIAFSPAHTKVDVELLSKPGMQGLAIHDQGPGVSKEQLSHMFELFTKADGDDALKMDHEGLGVDLYLNKLIMEHLGGEISAESTLGHGTTVKMWWPVH